MNLIASTIDGHPKFENHLDISNLGCYLVIENNGEIQEEALELLGASTKDGINTIGEFGSGNKYALAYFVRHNIDFTIYSGTKKMKVTSEAVNFRDNVFNRIKIGDRLTSITDNLGKKDWSLWMAMREIISNSLDEGEFKIYTTNKPTEEEGKTKFVFLLSEEVIQYILNIQKYFSWNCKALIASRLVTVFKKPFINPIKVYRKGILVYENPNLNSLYDYEFNEIEINESRIVKDTSLVTTHIIRSVGYALRQFGAENESSSYIDSVILNDNTEIIEKTSLKYFNQWIEGEYYASYFFEKYFINDLLDAKYPNIRKTNPKEVRLVPDSLYEVAKKLHRTIYDMSAAYRNTKFSEKEQYMLKKVKEIFKECNLVFPEVTKKDTEFTVFTVGDSNTGVINLYESDFSSIYDLFKNIQKRKFTLEGKDDSSHYYEMYVQLLFEKNSIII